MITVKFYGLLRLDSGIKELHLEAGNVSELLQKISSQCPGLSAAELKGSVILLNGGKANLRSRLHAGDTVQLLSPVAGG